jgi:hypothetical protein
MAVARPAARVSVSSPLDPFIPIPDARERHAVMVRAPAALVYQVARAFDVQSLWGVRAIFGLRGRLMGSAPSRRTPRGFIDEMIALGWGCLVERPGEVFIAGAVCQPWLADVVFRAMPAERFPSFAEPDLVKIAWTIEAHASGPALTQLASETRAVATDAQARKRFLRYWRWARFGIIPIRWLLLPAIRRAAEEAASASAR